MVNIESFSKRLKKVIDYYELSASSFADKIGVQRSSISHLLSGRNKPSLDFVLKVLDIFEEVTWEWLLFGKGNFPQTDLGTTSPTLFSEIEEDKKEIHKKGILPQIPITESDIEQIVIFYKNGSFKSYCS